MNDRFLRTLRPVHLREMLPVDVAEDCIWPLDRDQVMHAVWALLQNAAEAVDAVETTLAHVALRMRPEAGSLDIVENNGAGVPPESSGRIFRPFHTTKPQGTGIGLSLALQIARAHGGALRLLQGSCTVVRMTLR